MTFFALLLGAQASWGQFPHPQLEPAESILLFSPESPEHIAAVRETMLKDIPYSRAFLVLSSPSFESAWVSWVKVEPEAKASLSHILSIGYQRGANGAERARAA